MGDAVRQLRVVGLIEGASFVLLLGVAMPLKYLADTPGPVRVVGALHRVLFCAYVAAALRASLVRRWPAWLVLALLAASVLPLGPFVVDRRLRREEGRPLAAPDERAD